jgi:transposase InsO family protein
MNKYAHKFSIERMTQMFDVSRSGYYRFAKATPSKCTKENEVLLEKIKKVHRNSRQTYGSPRIQAEIISQGDYYSRKRIARLMQQEGIQAKMKKRFKKTTVTNPKAKAAPNLLNQNFAADEPNQRWVADITYVATGQGWLYVAAVMDLFSRRIVGLAMSERMTSELVISALKQALTHRSPKQGLMHHSDKGCQYTSKNFQELLKENNIIVSMSGTGNCYDNAAMESFFHTLKTEHVHFENYMTREQAMLSIFEYVEVFYNRQRLHSTLGYLSPAVYETKGLCPLNPGIFKDMIHASPSIFQEKRMD